MTASDVGERLYDPAEVEAVYQPIVDLVTGRQVAAEALARWPGIGVAPDAAFEAARAAGRVAELDAACQAAALRGAGGVDVPQGFRLFVNVEPGDAVETLGEASAPCQVVVEITERTLLDDPARLLRGIRQFRRRGWGIALDDVGAVPDSLALLPFVAPDVIKLDVSLVQRWPRGDQARIVTAVAAYAERSGATILAEGIETPRDRDQALALGATLGQGWLFARPGPLAPPSRVSRPIGLLGWDEHVAGTPFGLIDPCRLREGSKGLLLGISRHLEQQGLSLETPPVLLGAFQDARHFTGPTAQRYGRLATRCPLVAALGAGLEAEPAPGVRGAGLAADDHLLGEWTVVVIAPHYTGALIAQDLGDHGPDLDRRFGFVLTHDPDVAVPAARSMLERVAPVG